MRVKNPTYVAFETRVSEFNAHPLTTFKII